MALNPAVNPPRLQPSSHTTRASTSRSPSRSPVRPQHFDPLLRDLSPTKTLHAFSSPLPDASAGDHLSRSVESATSAQRALGTKAAQTCLDMRSWARELELWHWPGTFDSKEPADAVKGDGAAGDEAQWASLPVATVRAYQHRVADVRRQLNEVDVEELKDFVLSAHSQASSAPADAADSIGAIGQATDLKKLDDFTALITATILQTLPYIARLHRLLETWTVRLAVLAAVPGFVSDLHRARADLDRSWDALNVSTSAHGAAAESHFSKDFMISMKADLSNQISSLGRRLDRFLDRLEGRPETVPDAWIDQLELLEGNYGDWVVQAERRVLEQELEESRRGTPAPVAPFVLDRTVSQYSIYSENAEQDRDAIVQPSSFSATTKETSDSASESTSLDTDEERLAFTGASGVSTIDAAVASLQNAQTDPERAESPTLAMYGISRSSSTRIENDQFRSSPGPTIARSRHVPLLVDYSQYGDLVGGPNIAALDRSYDSSSPLTPAELPSPTESIRTRAAFFNGDFEKSGALNKSKSPPVVRPFEHASNAFTRLFKRNSSPERRNRNVSSSPNKSPASREGGSRSVTPLSHRGGNAFEAFVTERPGTAGSYKSRIGKPRSHQNGLEESEIPGRRSSIGQSRPSYSSSRTSGSWTKPVPETYKPTGMKSSPSRSTPRGTTALLLSEFPPDWPLSSNASMHTSQETTDDEPTDESSDDTSQAGAAASTEAFDRRFVDDLSSYGNSEPATPRQAGFGRRSLDDTRRTATPTRRSLDNDAALSDRPAVSAVEDLNATNGISQTFSPSPSRARSARDQSIRMLVRPISTVKEEEDIYSYADEPLPAASPQESIIPDDDFVAFGHAKTLLRGRSKSASNLSPTSTGLNSVQHFNRPAVVNHASSTSIEIFPRSQLKSIDLRPSTDRRHSASAIIRAATPSVLPSPDLRPTSPEVPDTSAGEEDGGTPLLSYDGQVFPTPPGGSRDYSPRSSDSQTNSPAAGKLRNVTSPAAVAQTAALNGLMTKRRHNHASVPSMDKNSRPSTPSSQRQSGDNFDRHVSAVLDRMHAPIRFKSRAGAETPLGQRASDLRTSNSGRPRSSRSQIKTGSNLTLVPAEPSSKKSRTGADDVKLYHLQRDRDEPVKLFVRLVGEDERVMVRVGGGWADLADYLRQYAEHHGSRAVSDSAFEVQTAAGSPTLGHAFAAGTRRTFSTPVDSSRARTSAASAPSGNDDRAPLAQPQPAFGMGDDDQDPYEMEAASRPDSIATPQQLPRGYYQHTPTSSPSYATTRPSTTTTTSTSTTTSINRRSAGASNGSSVMTSTPRSTASLPRTTPRTTPGHTSTSAAALAAATAAAGPPRPTSRSGPGGSSSSSASGPTISTSTSTSTSTTTTTAVGLSGTPLANRAELPEAKARWVEDMLGRARAGAEQRRSDDDEQQQRPFADLGRVGGTRRLVFRGP